MKRIVFAVTNDLSYDQRMQRICGSLQHAGYDVELIGRQRSQSKPLEEKLFSQRRLKCLFSKGPLFYAEYNLRLFFLLLGNGSKIFGACDLDTILAVTLAAKLKRRRTIFDAHEHFAEVPEVERRRFVKAVWHRIGRWCIPKMNVRFTVGEKLAEELTGTYKAPFSVIKNVPILRDEPILSFAQREKLIVYQGALNEGRGLEQAIEAMQVLPEFRLRLIGEGDLSSQLRIQVKDLGLEHRVEFSGYVLPKDIPALTNTAMVGLNLLEARSKSYYLSLANKFFDYMHAGVPSVNMNFPEYENIIALNPVGVCINTLNAEIIAEVIMTVTRDQRRWQEMVDACETMRSTYAWQSEEQKLLQILSSVVMRVPANGLNPAYRTGRGSNT